MCRAFRPVTLKAAHFGVGVTAGCSSIWPPGCVTATWLVVAFVNDALLAFEIHARSVDRLPTDDTGPGFYAAATTSALGAPAEIRHRSVSGGTPDAWPACGGNELATARQPGPARDALRGAAPTSLTGTEDPSPALSPRLRCSLRSELGNKSLTAPAPQTRPVRAYPSSLQCQGCIAFGGPSVYEVVNSPSPRSVGVGRARSVRFLTKTVRAG
jgi:hypothetical protein